jgi:hypothetical protein
LRRKKNSEISKGGKGLAARRARHLWREGVAIEEMEKAAKGLRMLDKKRQNWMDLDAINKCLRTEN